MTESKHTDQALRTALEFQGLLHEMQEAYDPQVNLDKRWLLKDQEQLGRWIGMLEAAENPEAINELWREVQNISRIMGCTLDDELGQRYRQLEHELFSRVLDLVVEARRQP